MALKSEPTSQSLERKLMIAGFEIPDLLAIFSLLATLNFLFGATGQKLLLVWLPTAALALALRLGKRGKPDNYLVHLARFHFAPKYLLAFSDPSILSHSRRGQNV